MISKLQAEKRIVATTMIQNFILNNEWLKNIKEIKISSSGGDSVEDLPCYSFRLKFINKNLYDDEEENGFATELQSFFYLIKEDVDSHFLHYERETDKYMITGANIPSKLQLFIISKIW